MSLLPFMCSKETITRFLFKLGILRRKDYKTPSTMYKKRNKTIHYVDVSVLIKFSQWPDCSCFFT